MFNAAAHLAYLDFNGYAALMGVATLLLFWVIERFFPKFPPDFWAWWCFR